MLARIRYLALFPVVAVGVLLPGPPNEWFENPAPAAVPAETSPVAPSGPAATVVEPANAELPAPSFDALRTDLDRMVAGGARGALWGVLAVSLERGDTLFALNPTEPLTPASNVKLLTTAAALHHLGPDFRFPTFLLADGEIRDGVLHGDLIVFGTGDPTLGERDPLAPGGAIATFLAALEQRGVREVRGAVLGDGSYFAGEPRRPSWNPRDLNEWYAAPVSALTFNENMVTLRVMPGALPGAPARVATQPEGAGIPMRNLTATVSGRPSPSVLVVRDGPDDLLEVRGQIQTGGRDVWRNLTVSDPPAYAASILREAMVASGIAVTGPAAARAPGDVVPSPLSAPAFIDGGGTRTLAIHHSPPLPEILSVINKRSHNLYAELLLFTLGRLVAGDATFEGGAGVIRDFLVDVVGIPEREIHIDDGSGLSRLNRASPGALVRLVAHMERGPHADVFFASLPEAGNRQELGRMYRSAAAGNLRAKTGTIRRVSALSGIVRTAEGEPVAFSIIANEVPSPWFIKRIEDDIGIRLAGFTRPLPDALPGTGSGSLPGSTSVADDRR